MQIRIRLTCLAAVLLLCGRSVFAQDNAGEAVLKSKGFTKVGLTYLLDGDLKLRDSLRTMRKAKNDMESGLAKRSQLEKKIKLAEAALETGEARDHELSAAMDKSRGVPYRYNQLVDQVNAVRGQMREAVRFAQDCQKELNKLSDPRDEYITAVLDISDSMEATAAKYDTLAADPAVQKALTGINLEAKAKLKLGPSFEFAHELPLVRHERSTINSAAIKFNNETGTPQVNVILNGSVTVPMILDSGASVVSISWAVAKELGMTPGPNDPKVQFTIADGRHVEATIMTLKSVRLGQFTVENVVCSVAPESEKNTPNLLGGTFLQNFVYKMDLGAGVVHMSQLTGKPTAPDAKTAGASSPGNRMPPVPTPGQPSSDKGTASGSSALVEKGWTILFRSADPADWNTDVHDGSTYAVPLDKAPADMLYLRVRNSVGDYVILALTAGDLRQKVLRDNAGWEGRDYKAANGRHLGIVVKSLARSDTGSVDITQSPPNGGWTGYGFGNRVGKEDGQGFAWAGKPTDSTMMEIAVKSTALTAAEKQRLLPD